jgi:phage baseplate assembly protein W
MTAKLYKGISFTNYKNRKTLFLGDIDLVKQDLLNHISTKLRERRMMPEFGTRIPMLPFEPMDDNTLFAIEEDLTTVVNYDPRVVFNVNGPLEGGVALYPDYDQNVVTAVIDLFFVELDVNDSLVVTLDLNS